MPVNVFSDVRRRKLPVDQKVALLIMSDWCGEDWACPIDHVESQDFIEMCGFKDPDHLYRVLNRLKKAGHLREGVDHFGEAAYIIVQGVR
jgi:hypothetical protein